MDVKLKNLKAWTDIDIACHELALSIGIVREDHLFSTDVKWLYWSNNKVGNLLYKMLEELVEIGYLEKNEIDEQVRLNSNFVLK